MLFKMQGFYEYSTSILAHLQVAGKLNLCPYWNIFHMPWCGIGIQRLYVFQHFVDANFPELTTDPKDAQLVYDKDQNRYRV